MDIGDDAVLGLCADGRRLWLRGPAVPGDRVLFRPEGKGGRILRLLRPAEGRLSPPCPHFDACPGCLLQPLPYERQLALKAGKLTESLRRLGGMDGFDFRGLLPSPQPYGTRNKLDLHVNGPNLGYLTPEGFLPLHDCHLGAHVLRALLPPLRDWLAATPAHRITRATLRTDSAAASVHLVLRGTAPAAALETLISRLPSLHSLSLQAAEHQPLQTLWGEATLLFHLAGESHTLPPDAFFQIHDRLADTLVRTCMDWLGESPTSSLLDLFSGAGAFTLPAARRVPQVLGLDHRCPPSGPFQSADLRRGLPRTVLARRWDCVLTDPPRSGMTPELLRDLRLLRPHRLLYISCNPATLARDLKSLCADNAYALDRVQGFDLFPQTSHLESLCLLTRKGPPPSA